MTDREEFILSELERLQREIDVLKEVYAHSLKERLKREELVEDAMMRAMMEEVTETNSEQLEEGITHSKGAVEKIEELEEKIEELEVKIEELEEI
jgi:phage shock protein A